ncbi:YiiD C-terminal domain-containing protein [candidate division KSB1 bacterium]|nr:YiiD C-terminal domain-containing protein [candidate division KSB1 bacterium]
MDAIVLQKYLHEHIPLSQAMGVEVVTATGEGVTLFAPLAQNLNHRETVFGGSASALAILSAWTLINLKLEKEGLKARIVIQRNCMKYERLILGGFTASAAVRDLAAWRRFTDTLKRKHRARMNVSAELHCNEEKVGEFEGDFVAMALSHARSE